MRDNGRRPPGKKEGFPSPEPVRPASFSWANVPRDNGLRICHRRACGKNHSMLKNSIVGHLDAAYIMIRLCSSFLKARPFSYTQKLSPHSGPEWRNEGTENESLPKKTGRHIRHLPVRDIFPVKSPHGRRSGLTDIIWADWQDDVE